MAAYSPGGFHSTGFPRGVWLPRTPPITHCAGAMPSALHGLLYHSQHAKTERKSLRVRGQAASYQVQLQPHPGLGDSRLHTRNTLLPKG